MGTSHCVHCVLIAWGCSHHTGVYWSHGGVLVTWGCTGHAGMYAGVFLSHRVFSSCGGDMAVVAPVHLVAPCQAGGSRRRWDGGCSPCHYYINNNDE
jgi:hypothetical protein